MGHYLASYYDAACMPSSRWHGTCIIVSPSSVSYHPVPDLDLLKF